MHKGVTALGYTSALRLGLIKANVRGILLFDFGEEASLLYTHSKLVRGK